MNPPLIALYSSEPKSGKSEVALRLMAAFGYQTESFAEPIKAMLGLILTRHGYSADTVQRMLYGDLKNHPLEEFGGRDPRFLMETLGTAWGRKIVFQDLWVRLLRTRVRLAMAYHRPIVVDDLRKPNEYRALQDLGAIFVRVVRPGAPQDTASDEGQLDAFKFHATILNDGSLRELQAAVTTTMEDLRARYPRVADLHRGTNRVPGEDVSGPLQVPQ